MQGTLLVRWEKGDEEAMAVVTDGSEELAELAWDQLRIGIEDEDRDYKRGGWEWQHPQMQNPRRAERLWLAMAVAMPMTILVGGLEEAQEEEHRSGKRREAVRPRWGGRPARPVPKLRGRLGTGQQRIPAAVVRAEALPQGEVGREPWPTLTARPIRSPDKQGGEARRERQTGRTNHDGGREAMRRTQRRSETVGQSDGRGSGTPSEPPGEPRSDGTKGTRGGAQVHPIGAGRATAATPRAPATETGGARPPA